jgi:Trypsin-like peptidase domain
MTVAGKLAADGSVQVTCPQEECGTVARVRPKAARSGVVCKNCGEKFILEVPELAGGAQPSAANGGDFNFFGDGPVVKDPLSPKSERHKAPSVPDRPSTKSQRRVPAKSNKGKLIALGAGGGVVVVGGVIALVIALGGKTENPNPKPKDKEKEVAAVPANKLKDEPAPKPKSDRPSSKPKGEQTKVNPEPQPPEPTPPEPKTEPKPEPPPPEPKTIPKPKIIRPTPKTGIPPDFMDRENDPKLKAILSRTKKATPLVEGARGAGSAFMIRPGIMVTNAHVIEGELLDDIKVRFVSLSETDPKPIKPTLLYKDKKRDLAIFRIAAGNEPLQLTGSGTELEGLRVAVVGNPMQAANVLKIGEVTFGALKAPARVDDGIFFQLDAFAAPGNSGGPVIEEATGKVVGVLTAGIRGRATTFCIPYTDVAKALDRLPPTEKEADGSKVAAARHYLEMIGSRLPEIEDNATIAMELQRLFLRGDDTAMFAKGGKVYRMAEVMKELKDQHAKMHKTLTGLLQSNITPLKEIPETLRQAAKTRLDTCTAMRQLADKKSTDTEVAFVKSMEQRKSASEKAAQTFDAEMKKYQEQIEKKYETEKK